MIFTAQIVGNVFDSIPKELLTGSKSTYNVVYSQTKPDPVSSTSQNDFYPQVS